MNMEWSEAKKLKNYKRLKKFLGQINVLAKKFFNPDSAPVPVSYQKLKSGSGSRSGKMQPDSGSDSIRIRLCAHLQPIPPERKQ